MTTMTFFNLNDKYNHINGDLPTGNNNNMTNEQNIITDKGRKLLGDKIRNLISQKPALAEEVAIARDNGGMEENEELEMALNAVERVEREIKKYENILATYRLVDIPEKGEYEKVLFGCKVKLFNLNTEKELTYQLLGEFESDPSNGVISVHSPLGKELIGLMVGDIAEVERARNEYTEYEVLEIFVD